jgi:hypothetical protein
VVQVAGGKHQQYAALNSGQQSRRTPFSIDRGSDVAGQLHLPDAHGDRGLPSLHQIGHHGLRGWSTLPRWPEQTTEGAEHALVAISGDQHVAPGQPGRPRGEVAQHRLLVGQHLIGLVLSHGQQQFVLPAREVVEQLALADLGACHHVFEAHLGDTPRAHLGRRRDDDASAGLQPLRGQHLATSLSVPGWCSQGRARSCHALRSSAAYPGLV